MKNFLLIVVVLFFSKLAMASKPVSGTYEVPIKNPELKQFASFPIKYKSDNYETIPSHIEYPLPIQLTGNPIMVIMEKSNENGNIWHGQNVTGVCDRIETELICNVKFKDLKIDKAAVQRAIETSYQDPVEQTGRAAVATSFSTEPIGILRYKLRGSSEDYN